MKKLIIRFLSKYGFDRRVITNQSVLDKSMQLIRGTVHKVSAPDEAWLFELAKHHRIIFDVGSNIGQFTVISLYHKDVEKVVLFDPNPLALSYAAQNVVMNGLGARVTFITSFVSDKDGESVKFYSEGAGAAGSKYKSFAKTAYRQNDYFVVQTKTLDTLAKEINTYPTLVKIDVEGAETDVLKGATGIAKDHHPWFFVEIHSGEELSITENTRLILDWCEENDYTAWYMKTHDKLAVEMIKNRGRYHALLLPAGIEFPQYLTGIHQGDQIR